MTTNGSQNKPDFLIREFQEANATGEYQRFSFTLRQVFNGMTERKDVFFQRVESIERKNIDHPIFDALGYLRWQCLVKERAVLGIRWYASPRTAHRLLGVLSA
jgi:hypothetical protein